MHTRRDLIVAAVANLCLASGARAAAPTMTTPDGYTPPSGSRGLLAKVRFDKAVRAGKKYSDRFDRWDGSPKGKKDPSVCRGMYEIPDGQGKSVLFWESKMGIDTDGASKAVREQDGSSDPKTSYHFKDGVGVNSEIVPYFVLPTVDDINLDPARKKFPNGPWEDSKDNFIEDFRVERGNLGVVILAGKMTGAIFVDEGPAMKIGEASLRTHELVRSPPHPWISDPADKKLNPNDGVDGGVLYVVFPGTKFDINRFGSSPSEQLAMTEEIRKEAQAAFDAFIKAQS